MEEEWKKEREREEERRDWDPERRDVRGNKGRKEEIQRVLKDEIQEDTRTKEEEKRRKRFVGDDIEEGN